MTTGLERSTSRGRFFAAKLGAVFGTAWLVFEITGFATTIRDGGMHVYDQYLKSRFSKMKNTAKPPPPPKQDPSPPRLPASPVEDFPNIAPIPKKKIMIEFARGEPGRTGALITRIGGQSVFLGWLCTGDRVLSINGEDLRSDQPASKIVEAFETRIIDTPNYKIAFQPTFGKSALSQYAQSDHVAISGADVMRNSKPRSCETP